MRPGKYDDAVTTPWAKSLRREMIRRSWRAADAAKAMGVDSSVMSKWLSGIREPDLESCRRIAENLGRPLLEIAVKAGLITAEEAGEKPLQDLDWAEISSVELVAELQSRLASYEEELDRLRGFIQSPDDDQEDLSAIEVPGIPQRRSRQDGRSTIKR